MGERAEPYANVNIEKRRGKIVPMVLHFPTY